MSADLHAMSLKELKDLQGQVNRAIASFEDRQKKKALAEVEDKARELGFTLNELLGMAPTRKRAPAKAKYANPANPAETWTGRGRKPRWADAALKSGKSLADLAI